jgi:SAM-dependent methyltransferase
LLRRREAVVYRHRVERDTSPVSPLVRLFLLGDSVETAELERALGRASRLLNALGLAQTVDDTTEATIRLVPHDDLLVASDRDDSPTGRQHVAGVHGPSATLAHLTVRRQADRALDLGTGNGIQALLLARHSERVVATDVNERALAFAEFNAALNGVDNIDLRSGSFLEPVAGERFDVVVANPPYVISPESSLLFRDSGMPGDSVSSELVRALPAVLADGAFATVMVSWVQSGDDLTSRPRAWIGDGCDALILHSSTADALSTAAQWNRDQADSVAYAKAVDRWLSYYAREGIDAVAYGAVVLRRRDGGRTWLTATELPQTPVAPASDQLARMFANRDALSHLSDGELVDSTLALVPSARIVQTLQPSDDGWVTVDAELVLDEGLGFRGGLEGAALLVALGLDGRTPLRVVVERVAAETGADAEAVGALAATLARRALELGFAEVVS